MKKKNNQRKSLGAMQYFRVLGEAQNLLESISAKTETEHQALLENGNSFGDVDDKGLFDMDKLLDVNLKDFNDTPKIYNSPQHELSDSDKGLISDEFAKQLMNTRADTVDLENIGPMSTAIAMKNGFLVTSVEDFIKGLIDTSVEKQDSQAIALGLQEVPGMQEIDGSAAPEMGDAPMGDVPVEVTVVDPAMDVAPATEEMPSDMAAPEAPVVPEMGDAPVDNMPPADDMATDVPMGDAPVDAAVPAGYTPSSELDLEKEHADMAGKLEDKAKASGDEEAANLAADLKEGEMNEVKDLEGNAAPKGEAAPEESDEEEESKLNAKLESIKNSYMKNVLMEANEKALVAKLESIKGKYLGSLVESAVATEPAANAATVVEAKVETPAVVESKETKQEAPKAMVEEGDDLPSDQNSSDNSEGSDLFEAAQSQLESLVSEYLESEKIQEKEKALTTQLESIANGYLAEKEAEKKAAERDSQVVAQLESITKNFQETENARLDSKKKAKARLDELKK